MLGNGGGRAVRWEGSAVQQSSDSTERMNCHGARAIAGEKSAPWPTKEYDGRRATFHPSLTMNLVSTLKNVMKTELTSARTCGEHDVRHTRRTTSAGQMSWTGDTWNDRSLGSEVSKHRARLIPRTDCPFLNPPRARRGAYGDEGPLTYWGTNRWPVWKRRKRVESAISRRRAAKIYSCP